MRLFILIASISLYIKVCVADCCSTEKFNFQHAEGKSCEDYPGGHLPIVTGGSSTAASQKAYFEAVDNVAHRRCRASVCSDGKPPTGSYCGRGSCNFFGCNCDGGCLPGNAKQSFFELHKDAGETYERYGLVDIVVKAVNVVTGKKSEN